MKIITLVKYIILTVAMLLATSMQAFASNKTYCETIQEAHEVNPSIWDRKCGPKPGSDFRAAAVKDCAATTKAIEARPGASWNSEIGWMFEDQCERLNKGLD